MAASMCNSRFVGYQWIKLVAESNISNLLTSKHNRVTCTINNYVTISPVSSRLINYGDLFCLTTDHLSSSSRIRPTKPVLRPKKIPTSFPTKGFSTFFCHNILLGTGFDREYVHRKDAQCVVQLVRRNSNVNKTVPFSKRLDEPRPSPRPTGVSLLVTNFRPCSSPSTNYVHCRSICTNCRRKQHTGIASHQQFSHYNLIYRSYSEDVKPQKKVPMHLTDFPEIIWPSIIKSLRNWILANFIVTPYFDREFNLPDFIQGSKKALDSVSQCFSKNEFEKLDGLVAPETLQEVRRNMSSFSVQQREELYINQDDIYFSFPYQLGVMFSDDDNNQKRFVEITMCYHVLQGLDELRKAGTTPPINMGMLPEYRDKIHICNYRFIREFTKGVDGEWTINALNHFKPSDYVS